jgi:uncharacterized protein (TIGR03086 family)
MLGVMSAVSERYRRLATAVTDRIEAIPADAWDNRTPCEDWTIRDVVRHLAETQGMFARLVGLEITPDPAPDADPAAAWASARDQMQALLDDPANADRGYKGLNGPTTFARSVDQYLCFDLNVHGWDIARGAGLTDDRIDPAELPRLWQDTEVFGDNMRLPGAFGPAVDVPTDAPEQDRLLAYLGRRP